MVFFVLFFSLAGWMFTQAEQRFHTCMHAKGPFFQARESSWLAAWRKFMHKEFDTGQSSAEYAGLSGRRGFTLVLHGRSVTLYDMGGKGRGNVTLRYINILKLDLE